ncbi:MAG: Fur family transcriptional regulator [Vallitaleaceae bacterium]|jgi:Fe2+ or Zn2+ uptake regulation protein|nr:Fur family transcriptional regulator [Vallitaleaceae bacterium]
MTLDNLLKTLHTAKCRMTSQRRTIIDVLLANENTLLSADHLLKLCQQKNPDINTTTVYRNLELLDALKLMYTVNIDRNTMGYKLVCHDYHHHHMICLICGKMEAIEYCPISPDLIDQATARGFSITNHNLELYGYCHTCHTDLL